MIKLALTAAAAAALALTVAAGEGRPDRLLGGGRVSGPIMFDDFGYRSRLELGERGWSVRTRAGGPGAPDAAWSEANVTLVDDPARAGNRLLRLTASTDGTAAGTSQAEVSTAERTFREGTYAARVRFSDQPVAGPDGDRVVQTFFAISPLARPLDPDYSELDFEYVPNGGWGTTRPTLFMTSWETYQEEPWIERMENARLQASQGGWRTLVIQVAGGAVRYFVDGRQAAVHRGDTYPESVMTLNFNLWFQRDGLVGSRARRVYQQDVDWVLYQADAALTTQQVTAAVAQLRRGAVRHP